MQFFCAINFKIFVVAKMVLYRFGLSSWVIYFLTLITVGIFHVHSVISIFQMIFISKPNSYWIFVWLLCILPLIHCTIILEVIGFTIIQNINLKLKSNWNHCISKRIKMEAFMGANTHYSCTQIPYHNNSFEIIMTFIYPWCNLLIELVIMNENWSLEYEWFSNNSQRKSGDSVT